MNGQRLLSFLTALFAISIPALAQQIDYRALGTNAFYTNSFIVNSKHWTNQSGNYLYPPGRGSVDSTGTIPGPGWFLRKDGSFFGSTNVTKDIDVTDYSFIASPYIISMIDSNEPASVFGDWIVSNSENYDYYTKQSFSILGDKDNPLGFFTMYTQGTNGNSSQIQFAVDPSGGVGFPAIRVNRNGGSAEFILLQNGDLNVIKSLTYSWPTAYGGANAVLSDTDGAGTLRWTNIAAIVTNNQIAVAAGTNIVIVTNGNVATISVNGLTNIINILTTNSINQNARIGPGTNNFLAKFNVVGGTNVGNSPLTSSTTNSYELMQAFDGSSWTNSGTNRMYGEYTGSGTNQWLEIVTPKGHNNEVAHIRHRAIGQTLQRSPIYINDSWAIEPTDNPLSGHSAGYMYPLVDNSSRIGSSSSRVLGVTIGTGNLVVGNSSSKPSVQLGADGGLDGDANSLQFFRPTTGITASFNRNNNLFLFDLAGNTIAFGTGLSNGISFIGHSALTGLIQVGTNSGVAAPATAGLVGGQASGNNFGGSDLLIIGGPSTGTGTNGNVRIQTAEKALASSSSLNSSFKDRLFIIADPIILTTNSATIVFNATIPTALRGFGGKVIAHTEIENGVDIATTDEEFMISANRKGTTVVAGTPSAPVTSTSTSGGSAAIANTWTLVANAQSVDLKLTCVTSGIISTNSTVRVTFIPNSSAVPVITHP